MLGWLAKRARRKRNAHDLYGSIVALSRSPIPYTEFGVPDTLEARFEVLVLHMFIFIERLQAAGEDTSDLSQEIVDLFFADMDTTSREAGVGDLAIPKKMRKLAAVFQERMTRYRQAVDASDREVITREFMENIYQGHESAEGNAAKLAEYAWNLRAELAQVNMNELQFAHERDTGKNG